MDLSHPRLSAPLRTLPKAICPSCGVEFDAVDHGNGKKAVFCGLQACYAEAIREHWKALGYVATVQYGEGSPRLVGWPVKR